MFLLSRGLLRMMMMIVIVIMMRSPPRFHCVQDRKCRLATERGG
jgi:hypothetical protein